MIKKNEALEDFKAAYLSRECSILGRRDVLSGRGKFGIFGDGKEVPQVAMARAFRKGDWRSGYYRDQTFMMAIGLLSVEQFFAQLYADAENDPFSGGRQMNCHFASPTIDKEGNWLDVKNTYNTSSDVSSTAGQMARALGLAFASDKYRTMDSLKPNGFSDKGNEVCFATIGDASTSEGVFWETINAASVMQVPLAISVWDDGFGISVPKKYQTAKESISLVLAGFDKGKETTGLDIYEVHAWDYEGLRKIYDKGIEKVRRDHTPALFHIDEVTQPLGHSTSGSHERYKTKERLAWEKEYDGIKIMGEWLVKKGYCTAEEVKEIKADAKKQVREARDRAWEKYMAPANARKEKLAAIFQEIAGKADARDFVKKIIDEFQRLRAPLMHELLRLARRMKFGLLKESPAVISGLTEWIDEANKTGYRQYHTHLYSDSDNAAINIPVVPAVFSDTSPSVPGFQILNRFFDLIFEKYPNTFAFGEDVGKIGDVNQGFAQLQDKYGLDRIFDTGIREWTIVGQAIGMAMRGLRPIAEIQYLDYLLYGLVPLSDDLATLRYRTNGIQAAPAIIRTRGHRLEGIWHSGSPLGVLLNSLRGMYVCVPRNMTQAAGMYNTLLQSDDPAIVIESLNGYRLRERMPDNLDSFTVPLGVPEILQSGQDVTIVTYGSCVRVAEDGMQLLAEAGISVELIDVRTLLPFDLEHSIVESLKKTNRIVFLDEDMPGGASAFMMQQVLEVQNGYRYLDAAPVTLTAKAHRPPYGSDGDYFTKPNAEDVFEVVYAIMKEAAPYRF